jgi:acyl-CoA thioesterase-1
VKEVVLIGDSIRMGYEEHVRRELEGVASVWGPEGNCGPSERIVANLDEWIVGRRADLFHINAGLHDLKKAFDADGNHEPLDTYRTNVETILEAARATGAAVIWATTTPVNEKNHHDRKGFDRFEADVDRYNAAALAIVRRLDIPVNDLFGFVMENGKDEMLRPDGVHFVAAAEEKLGKRVAQQLRKYL